MTQNFVSRSNIDIVWLKTRRARPKLASKLLEQFKKLAGKKNRGGKYIPDHLIDIDHDIYRDIVSRIDLLDYVPDVLISSSSSSSSSSSDDDSDETKSEDSVDGKCMCRKCKIKRKKKNKMH